LKIEHISGAKAFARLAAKSRLVSLSHGRGGRVAPVMGEAPRFDFPASKPLSDIDARNAVLTTIISSNIKQIRHGPTHIEHSQTPTQHWRFLLRILPDE